MRPVWVTACASMLLLMVILFQRAERLTEPPPPAPAGWGGLVGSMVGTAGVCAGLAILALQGLSVTRAPAGLPLVGVASLAGGILLHQLVPAAEGAASPS